LSQFILFFAADIRQTQQFIAWVSKRLEESLLAGAALAHHRNVHADCRALTAHHLVAVPQGAIFMLSAGQRPQPRRPLQRRR
jgi:hypothetical protein